MENTVKTTKKRASIHSITICALFSALIAVGAFIKIPVPVIPFTLQVLFVLMAGFMLGAKLAFASVVAYIFIGLCGVPVFVMGGGPAYVMQPTFGYIIGFAVGAFIIGKMTGGAKQHSFKRMLLAGSVGMSVIYLIGLPYYYFIANYFMDSPIGVWTLLLHCFLLCLPGDILSCIVAILLTKRLKPALSLR